MLEHLGVLQGLLAWRCPQQCGSIVDGCSLKKRPLVGGQMPGLSYMRECPDGSPSQPLSPALPPSLSWWPQQPL